MACLEACAVLAVVFCALLPVSEAQILPGINLYAQLHRFAIYPNNQTAYGTPRHFKALIANIATSNNTALQKMNGTLTFLANSGQDICNGTLINNGTMSGAQLSANDVDTTLAVGALNNIIANNNLTGEFGSINTNALHANATQAALNETLGPIKLYPLRVAAGVTAECTESFLTPATYYALETAYSGVTLNGSQVGAGVLPVVNPNLNLNDYSFNVVKADTTIAPVGNIPNATRPGQKLNITALVGNASPSSIAYPDGGNVTVSLNGKVIGSATFSPKLQSTHRRKLLQTDLLTSLFNIPLTVPLGTPPGLQQLILAFTGNGNFNPSTTGLNGSPQGLFINIPAPVQTVISGTANPGTTPSGGQSQITGAVTDPTGAGTPTGSVNLNVGGKDFGPYGLTNGQYTGPVTAPAIPTTITGAPYPVTVTYLPDLAATGLYTNPSPPYTIPLNVSPATTTISETVSPASAGAGSPVTASGTVAGSNGAVPVGTVTTIVAGPGGATNYTVPINGPNYSSPFTAPGTTGSYSVTSVFTPAAGNSLGPATSAPQPLTVTPGTATVTGNLAPNPANPGAAIVVSGTVTSPTGPLAGAVQLYLNGTPVGTPVTLGAGGTYTTTIAAPAGLGQYPVRVDYLPTGSTTVAATTMQTLTVGATATSAAPATTAAPAAVAGGPPAGPPAAAAGGAPGGVAGLVNTALQLALGNGAQGFNFPSCAGNLAATVTSTPATVTGPITLDLSGGMLGDKKGTIGTVNLNNGAAIFNLVAQKLDGVVIQKLVTKLQPLKNHSLDDIHDKLGSDNKLAGLLGNKGALPLLPGQYTMTATYPGDAGNSAASVTAPWIVDTLCLAQILSL